ncbi:hypothetical protein BGX24_011630 [Mortierella sp. AD032]|nr:hypothetical protein BGX24_011630 [Mortierella sp. AD032]
MAFLNPLKSGAGVVPAEAEAAPETISGDIGQQLVHHQQVEEQGTLADKGSWEEIIATLDDIVVPGQLEHPNTEVSEQDDEQALEQEDQQQQQLQQRHESAYSTEYPSTTVKAPVSTSLYPKGFLRQKPSTGILSPPNQSTASSMADLSNNSSASITANMLAIKSHVFVQQEHQQPRLVPVVIAPIYQLSTPMSSTISLSTPSRSTSPPNDLQYLSRTSNDKDKPVL